MITKNFWDECKSLYTSPLAEEIVVSFEENFLGSVVDDKSMNTLTGGAGNAGYNGDSFSGNNYNL